MALVYCIIRKRALFHQLANLPIDHASIDKTVDAKKLPKITHSTTVEELGGSSYVPTSPTSDILYSSANEDPGEPVLHTSLPVLPGRSTVYVQRVYKQLTLVHCTC